MKVYVVGGAVGYTRFLDDAEITHNIKDADIVMFTGGEDVDPSIYGCKRHPRTWSNIERDKEEKKIFDTINPNQLVVGICRGLI